ncbi:gamma-glutamylputrescine oxidase [Marinobacterium nitratireducens]|uniref:Gamma-glutamylputrescine oxidase n=1 Tax=Marinobacterium nitratireducens TaxID=518897 RepID=A0A918DY90_9GAMM|nr:FAD-binding oxidoreductase [Marinobacterium nitratireducens]GGO88099.1 gamma-glutamylputrescine oxidase [Marinobacterium nitratireducens]
MNMQGYESSYYADSANPKVDYPPLTGAASTDVCVIGGGYTGLSAALHLAERGYSVTLLEGERVGWGASGRNGGQVNAGHCMDQADLEARLGRDHAKALWELSLESVELVKQLIERHRIDCDLKPGVLHAAAKRPINDSYRRTVDKLRDEYGYDGVRFVAENEMREMLGTHRYYGGELWRDGAHLHPLNYALGLAHAAAGAGVRIHENSRVTRYRAGASAEVRTERGHVKARYILLACNGYLGALEPRVAGKIMPINNFILATEPLDDSLARSLIRDDVAVADSRFVINYFRLSADNRLLWGGGENYSSRFPKDIKGFVRKYMLEVYPQLKDLRIDYGWGGTLAITLNRMPHFDRVEDNLFVAQGYSGHGIALATLGGKLMAEAIAETAERFDIFARVPTRTFPGGTLLRWPGLVAGMLYYSLRDRL